MPIYCAYATIVIFNSQYLHLSVFSVLCDFHVSEAKGVLKICSKFTGEYHANFSAGCSPVNLLHIFRTPFPSNTSGGLHLMFI